MTILGKIRVRDPNGVDLTLFEIEKRRFFYHVRQLKLDSGEIVDEIDGQLVIAATGEVLTRT